MTTEAFKAADRSWSHSLKGSATGDILTPTEVRSIVRKVPVSLSISSPDKNNNIQHKLVLDTKALGSIDAMALYRFLEANNGKVSNPDFMKSEGRMYGVYDNETGKKLVNIIVESPELVGPNTPPMIVGGNLRKPTARNIDVHVPEKMVGWVLNALKSRNVRPKSFTINDQPADFAKLTVGSGAEKAVL